MRHLPEKKLDALILTVYCVVTLAFACVPIWSYIYPAGHAARLAGPDSYVHLRHTEAVKAHYPRVERFDAMTNFPDGEVGLNQGFFDVTMATISLATRISATNVLAWQSPILVMLVGVACYFWIRRAAAPLTGAIFLGLYLLYPSTMVTLGSLGQGDHHAMEVALATLTALALDTLFQPARHWKWSPLAALPLFYLYLVWAGTPMHLMLVGLVFYVRAWMPISREQDPYLIGKGSLYGATLLAGALAVHFLLPWAVIWSTSERVMILASMMLAVGYPILVLYARRPWGKPALAACAFTLAPLLLVMLVPMTRELVVSLLQERSDQISEQSAVTMQALGFLFGALWVVALAAPVKIWWQQRFWMLLVPALYGGGLVLMWLKTRDFNYYAPPVMAAAGAFVLDGIGPGILLTSALTILALPPLVSANTSVQNPWLTPVTIRDEMLFTDGIEDASRWLRETKADMKPDSPDSYGLVTPWDMGSILAESTGISVVWSQTSSAELSALFYTIDPEQAYATMTSRRRPMRYILLPARNLSDKFFGELKSTSLGIGDFYGEGVRVDYGGYWMKLVEPLPRYFSTFIVSLYWGVAQNMGHFRLVWQSSQQAIHAQNIHPERAQYELYSFVVTPEMQATFDPLLKNPNTPMKTSRGILAKGRLAPEIRIFEAVPGALLSGQGKPGTQVSVGIELKSPATGSTMRVDYGTTVGPNGQFEVRVPYPNDKPMSPAPGTIEVAGPYELVMDGKSGQVRVTEDDVQKGRRVAVDIDELVPVRR